MPTMTTRRERKPWPPRAVRERRSGASAAPAAAAPVAPRNRLRVSLMLGSCQKLWYSRDPMSARMMARGPTASSVRHSSAKARSS